MYIRTAGGMVGTRVVLIAVSSTDIASTNQSDALLQFADWDTIKPVEGNPAYKRLHARIWILPGSLLREDYLAQRWNE